MDPYIIGPVVLGAIGAAYFALGSKKDPVQSEENRPAKPGQSAPRRQIGVKELVSSPFPGEVSTLYEAFQRGVRVSTNGPCLGTRPGPDQPYVWQTYAEVNQRLENFGSGLSTLGLDAGARVGFYAKNCAEWVIGAQACNAYSLVSVAIYDTLGEENREYVVNQAGIEAIVTTANLLKNIVALAPNCPKLRHVIIIGDSVSDEERSSAEGVNLSIQTFGSVEKLGKEHHKDVNPPKPDDLAILMYTSGTTSRPKGVMMTHKNVVAVSAGVFDSLKLNADDFYLSYLPLAHILERAAEACIYCGGGKVGFYQGDLRKLSDDIATLAPTIFAAVPKVLQRTMNGVKAKVNASPVSKVLFSVLYCLKFRFMQLGLPTGIFDKIIFNKTKDALGGRVRVIVSGGAPLGAECQQFMSVCFCCPAIQGYGLTETCGGATITPPTMYSPWEKAGAPINCCEIKLVDAGNYSTSANPPRGEVCVRGDNITLGYYEMPEKTAEAFVVEEDGERWFHTGDVGQWNPDGTLSIVGRVKDIFKLDTGEYIAPERLETIFSQSKFVSNIFVYGDSDKSNVVAVVVPEVGAATVWAKEKGVEVKDPVEYPNVPASLCANKDLQAAIVADLKDIAVAAKLNRYEQVPTVRLDGTYWTADTGLVTAALKNKRDTLAKHYSKQIKDMYAELGQ